MGVDIDREAVDAAYKARNADAFAQLIAPLGIDLAFATLEEFVGRFPPNEWIVYAVIEAIVQALSDEHGIGQRRTKSKIIAIARREGAELLVGVASTVGRTYGFAEIRQWSTDIARNRHAVARWAAAPARQTDALRIPILVAPQSTADEAALLAAVIANPTDDAVRLVYADHLIEKGDPRGELIQTHCALFATPAPRDCPLRNAYYSLRWRHCDTGFKRDVAGADHQIRRGMIDEVTLTVASLAKLREKLFAKHPIQTLVVKVGSDAHLAKLAKLAADLPSTISRITLEASGAGELDLARPALASLYARRAVTFAGVDATDEQWRAILALVRSRELAFVRCNATAAIYQLLADPHIVPELTHLEIAGNPTPPAELEDLAAIGARLETLRFTPWHRQDFDLRPVMRALFERATFTRFETEHAWPEEFVVGPLLELPTPRQLRALHVRMGAQLLAQVVTRLDALVEVAARLPYNMPDEEIELVVAALARSKIERIYVEDGGPQSGPGVPKVLAERVPQIAFLARWNDGTTLLADHCASASIRESG